MIISTPFLKGIFLWRLRGRKGTTMLNTYIRRKYFEVSVFFLHVRMWELFAWNRVAIRVSNTLSNTCLLCNNYIVKGVRMCEV